MDGSVRYSRRWKTLKSSRSQERFLTPMVRSNTPAPVFTSMTGAYSLPQTSRTHQMLATLTHSLLPLRSSEPTPGITSEE